MLTVVRTPSPGGSVQATVAQYGPLWAKMWYFGTELGRLSINSPPETERVLQRSVYSQSTPFGFEQDLIFLRCLIPFDAHLEPLGSDICRILQNVDAAA